MDFAIRSRFRKWAIPGKCRRLWASRGVGPGEARRWKSPIFDIDADVDVVKRERDASGVGIAKDARNDGTFGMATSVGYLRSCLAAWTCTQALNRLILGLGRTLAPSTEEIRGSALGVWRALQHAMLKKVADMSKYRSVGQNGGNFYHE